MQSTRTGNAASMIKHHFFGSLVIVMMQAITVSAHASYSEQWLSPQRLQQEEAQARHRKPQSTCGSRTAGCMSAIPSARSANSHTTAPGHRSVTTDPIAAFAANDHATSRLG